MGAKPGFGLIVPAFRAVQEGGERGPGYPPVDRASCPYPLQPRPIHTKIAENPLPCPLRRIAPTATFFQRQLRAERTGVTNAAHGRTVRLRCQAWRKAFHRFSTPLSADAGACPLRGAEFPPDRAGSAGILHKTSLAGTGGSASPTHSPNPRDLHQVFHICGFN